MRLSVLDLGSNSFHVLVADVHADGRIVPVAREREMLHLGAVVATHGHVPDEPRGRAVDVVAHLTELAGRLGAEQRFAVATSALRDAANGAEVVEEMAAAAGTDVRIIDGEEEARLAYRGVRSSVALADDPVLVLDLGGGSLELAVGHGADVVWSTSLDLGVSRLSPMLRRDPPGRDEVRELHARARDAVAPLRAEVDAHAPRAVVAVGGTVRALARVVAAEDHVWLPATLNQYTLPAGELAGLRDRLVSMDAEERLALPGMKAKRADHLHAAAVILTAVLEALDVEEFVLSDWGLREGLLLEAVGAVTPPTRAQLRRREVERMLTTFTPDDPHLVHVADLAVGLFDATSGLHDLAPSDRELLWCGAALHDVGESLALRSHHRHGAYLIEHAELRGFTPVETAILCTLSRFHRSRGLSTDFPPYASLRKRDRRRAEQMVALLQVADGLDRARDQAVTGLTVDRADGRVHICLEGAGLHVARTEVDRKTAMFERVFGVPIEMREARTG